MGTQFSSRLNDSDKRRILDGLSSAKRAAVTPKRGQSDSATGSLTASQRRRMADAFVPAVLAVAEQHHFFDDFQKSSLFGDVFEWLAKLQSDARFNEFRNKIQEYGLAEAPNPVVQLTQELRKLVDTDEAKKPDPFRTAVSAAARIVLAEATARQIQSLAEDSPAIRLGRKLAAISLQDLVSRFIGAFLGEFFASLVSRADPDQSEMAVDEAVTLSREKAERVARRVVSRIEKEGQLAQTARIREILAEELHKVIDQRPNPVPVET
jgi:hypothetical protein